MHQFEINFEEWMSYFNFNTWELIAISIFLLLFLIQLYYYLFPFRKLYQQAKKSKENCSGEQPGVSVIIHSDNDAEGLKKALQGVLEQDYPSFEVIVVNDRYTEECQVLIHACKEKYSNLYSTYIPEESKSLSRKKLAITLAAKAAKNEILLLTEPHCEITSKNWIAKMVRNYSPGIDIVIGYCRVKSKNPYLKRLASFDNLFSVIQYLGKAVSGTPYKGSNRNLSYRKELFFKGKGFSRYMHLQAGEDDLFILENATEKNIQVEIAPESIPDLCTTANQWKDKKMRSMLTSDYYPSKIKLFLQTEATSRNLFYLTFCVIIGLTIPALFNVFILVPVGLLFLIRFLVQCRVINKTAKFLGDRKYRFSLIYLDFILPYVNLYYKICRRFDGGKDYTYSSN